MRLRILNASNGQDLAFGPTAVYDKSRIKFFSFSGTDTIYHHYGFGPNTDPGRDSLLYIDFDSRRMETVYVQLTSTDIDTLHVNYQNIDASLCCQDYIQAMPATYNGNTLQMNAGAAIIRK